MDCLSPRNGYIFPGDVTVMWSFFFSGFSAAEKAGRLLLIYVVCFN